MTENTREIIARDGIDKTEFRYHLTSINKIEKAIFWTKTGLPLSDGKKWIDFCWIHGEVTAENWEDVVAEDVANSWGFEII